MIDLDIKGFFDNLDHELVMKTVRHHVKTPWVLLYIERWLKAPVQKQDGSREERTKGSPQGSVVSPLLANLFMHYASISGCVGPIRPSSSSVMRMM